MKAMVTGATRGVGEAIVERLVADGASVLGVYRRSHDRALELSQRLGERLRWSAVDLEGAEGSVFYAPVGKIGRAFMEIEIEAFRMET